MAEENNIVEDYDDGILKCQKISKIIPAVCEDIEQIQTVNKDYALDFNLKLAKQRLTSLENLELDANSEDSKIEYVNEFRDNLALSLTNLGNFLESVDDLETLDDSQRNKFSNITANIVMHQESIAKIASS